MFEIGKKYEIRMIIDGSETTFWRTVEKYEHPLVKFSDESIRISLPMPPGFGNKNRVTESKIVGEIINVSSPNFISAVLKVSV